MALAVVVTFTIKPAAFADFMALMLRNAKTSLTREDGCMQFDVATDPDRPNEVFLYEVYKSDDAFQTHLRSDHFKAFDEATTLMIATKDVRTFSQVAQ